MEFSFIELCAFGVACWIGGNIILIAILLVCRFISDHRDGTEKQIWGYKSQSKWQRMRF